MFWMHQKCVFFPVASCKKGHNFRYMPNKLFGLSDFVTALKIYPYHETTKKIPLYLLLFIRLLALISHYDQTYIVRTACLWPIQLTLHISIHPKHAKFTCNATKITCNKRVYVTYCLHIIVVRSGLG